MASSPKRIGDTSERSASGFKFLEELLCRIAAERGLGQAVGDSEAAHAEPAPHTHTDRAILANRITPRVKDRDAILRTKNCRNLRLRALTRANSASTSQNARDQNLNPGQEPRLFLLSS